MGTAVGHGKRGAREIETGVAISSAGEEVPPTRRGLELRAEQALGCRAGSPRKGLSCPRMFACDKVPGQDRMCPVGDS